MSEELKPCPFCGVDCACTNWGNRSFDGGVRQVYFIAFCCGQTDDYDTEDEAIAAWNRRALSPQSGEGRYAIYEDGTMRAVNVRAQEHPDPVGLSVVAIRRREEG